MTQETNPPTARQGTQQLTPEGPNTRVLVDCLHRGEEAGTVLHQGGEDELKARVIELGHHIQGLSGAEKAM